jgi:hypothetical protein
METWQDLEKDIRAYLVGCKAAQQRNGGPAIKLTERMIGTILSAIKSSSFESLRVESGDEMLKDREIRKYISDAGLSEGDDFYYRISWSFAPSRYHDVAAFVRRYEEIVEFEMQRQQEIEAEIARQIEGDTAWDEYSYDELGCPPIAILLYTDRIEVQAFEPGWGDLLPKKGRKYIGCQGDIRWRFPLSALESLPKGYPIIDVAKIKAEKVANG